MPFFVESVLTGFVVVASFLPGLTDFVVELEASPSLCFLIEIGCADDDDDDDDDDDEAGCANDDDESGCDKMGLGHELYDQDFFNFVCYLN